MKEEPNLSILEKVFFWIAIVFTFGTYLILPYFTDGITPRELIKHIHGTHSIQKTN